MWRKILLAVVVIGALGVVALPAAFAQNPVWRAEYYNNATLSGSPTVTRNENNLAFNWGQGSPDGQIPSDGFSARFSTDVFLQAGTYRFWALADDNVRVTFNFQQFAPVIDTFASGQVATLVSGDVQVPGAGSYHIQVDYRENTADAYLFVAFANAATNPNPPNFNITTNIPVGTSPWVVQYYSNNSLAGDPAAILSVTGVTNDWGTGSPLSNIPADNFSARWTSTQNLAGGTYTITARADDGVRVYVNGVLQINGWGGTPGQTYTVTLSLPGGNNTFVVEYQEFTDQAYITFNITQPGQVIVQPTPIPNQPVPTGVTAQVTAFRLNVRDFPSATSNVITRINRFESYPVVGRLGDNTWYQIAIGSQLGWVAGRYVTVSNPGAVPVITPGGVPTQPTPVPTVPSDPNAYIVTATPYTVNLRSGPSTSFGRVARLPAGQTARIVGRNSSNTWWQVNYNGIVGWASAQYAILQQGADPNRIPVTG